MEETAIRKEQSLVAEARDGNLRSFSALVEIYQERAVHIAQSFVGNFEDARDIAQEAFVKAYEHLGDFKDKSRFYTWFYRILVNGCKDFLRRKKTRGFISLWLGRGEDDETNPVMQVRDSARDASEELIGREIVDEITQALERLPFQQKSAFSLRYLEGLSMEEIADCMGLTTGAVKAHLWQAGQKMRKFLGGASHGE